MQDIGPQVRIGRGEVRLEQSPQENLCRVWRTESPRERRTAERAGRCLKSPFMEASEVEA
jgi:hypothetical protein